MEAKLGAASGVDKRSTSLQRDMSCNKYHYMDIVRLRYDNEVIEIDRLVFCPEQVTSHPSRVQSIPSRWSIARNTTMTR
jgi:hypothetical protein